MSSSLLWIKIIFILALAVSFCYETTFAFSKEIHRKPDCNKYKQFPHMCTREWNPVCATNGSTYPNECVFCNSVTDAKENFGFQHYGHC